MTKIIAFLTLLLLSTGASAQTQKEISERNARNQRDQINNERIRQHDADVDERTKRDNARNQSAGTYQYSGSSGGTRFNFSTGLHTSLSGGYKIGMMKIGNLNSDVAAYNAERPWLETKMPDFGLMKGYEFTGQLWYEKTGFEFVVSRLRQTNDANGIETSTNRRGYRRIVAGLGGVSFGMMYAIAEAKHFAIWPTLDIDVHSFKAYSYYNTTGDFKDATPELEIDELMVSNTLSLNISLFASRWLGINFRPYCQLPWNSVSLAGLAPYAGAGNADVKKDWPVNAGISVSLLLAFNRDSD
ncbi:MAG: hypothetical protein ABI378_05950 [Chitinophagaceae bacterium]